MRTRGLSLLLVGLVVLGLGCHGADDPNKGNKVRAGSGSTAAGSTAAGSTGSSTPPPANAPLVAKATFANVAANGVATAGDTITVTFSKEVVLAGASDPAVEFSLPVNGDTFGAGATMAAGANPTDVVITLGTAPNFRVSGTFDVAFVGSGDASGIDVAKTPTGHISDPQGDQAAAYKPVDIDGPFTEGWTAGASLQNPRGGHTATLLNDGRVLIVGGLQVAPAANGQPAGITFCVENEIYDPVAGTFTNVSDPSLGGPNGGYMVVPGPNNAQGQPTGMPSVRTDHTATLLPNGQVLIAGGNGVERVDANGQPVQEDLMTAFLFDPTTNAFTLASNQGANGPQAATLLLGRSQHYAQVLSNGTVLIAGGFNGATPISQTATAPMTLPEAELFDPTAVTFTGLPGSQGGNDMTVPRQAGGFGYDAASKQVLFSGGLVVIPPAAGATGTSGQPAQPKMAIAPGAEVYDEASQKFVKSTAKPSADLRGQASATTPAGVIVIAGGDKGKPDASVDTYAAGKFTPAGKLATARTDARAAALGQIVLVTGGIGGAKAAELTSCEVVNADSAKVEKAPDMANARTGHTLTVLGNGKAIAIGGFNGASQQNPVGNPVAPSETYSRN